MTERPQRSDQLPEDAPAGQVPSDDGSRSGDSGPGAAGPGAAEREVEETGGRQPDEVDEERAPGDEAHRGRPGD